MTTRILVATALMTIGSVALPAQETYWIANRGSSDVMEIDACGVVRQTVAMGTSLRSAHQAPDGKVWVVRFIQSTFDILNADGTPFLSPSFQLGSAFYIAFDANGHAWVSGGTGVEEFDPNGVSVQIYPLNAGAPLGISVDANGNKWIAHRIGPPGSVSRIDGVTGAITNHPLDPFSGIQPVNVYADCRGIGQPSHIWVIGDRGTQGELTEMDVNGAVLNTYIVDPGGNLGSIVCDVDPATFSVRTVFIGDFRNGNVWPVDAATGPTVTLLPYMVAIDVIGVAIDGFQNVLATSRGLTAVLRLDAATGMEEMQTTVGSGVQSAVATGWQYVTTVDPTGDLDGDGAPNFIEIQNLSSPFDPCSTPAVSLSVEGSAGIGMASSLRVVGTGSTAVTFATALATTPVTVPGISCAFLLDAPSVFPISLGFTGGGSVALTIPNNAGLVGTEFYAQGMNVTAGVAAFSNLTCWSFY